MTNTLRLTLPLALALAAAPALAEETQAGWGLDLSVHAGLDKYDSVGLKNGFNATDFSDGQQLKDANKSFGATAIVRLGMLDVGGLLELGRPGQSNTSTFIGALGGVNLDVGPLRFEGLGELGGHRFGDILKDSGVLEQSTREAWLAYVGLRPGLSVRLGESGRWLLGVWAFARWDVMTKTVQATLADTSTGEYKLGGTQFGAALRLGFTL